MYDLVDDDEFWMANVSQPFPTVVDKVAELAKDYQTKVDQLKSSHAASLTYLNSPCN